MDDLLKYGINNKNPLSSAPEMLKAIAFEIFEEDVGCITHAILSNNLLVLACDSHYALESVTILLEYCKKQREIEGGEKMETDYGSGKQEIEVIDVVNHTCSSGFSPLLKAVCKEKLDLVSILLLHGASIYKFVIL